jgi:hypothetical protein
LTIVKTVLDEKVTVSAQIPVATRDELLRRAEAAGDCSISSVIRTALREYLEKDDSEENG